MPAFFFDSSSLVKRYAVEVGTNWVFSLVRASAKNRLYLARITGVEVVAALTKRMRVGSLTNVAAAKAVNRFEREFLNRYLLVETTPQIVRTAMAPGKKLHSSAVMMPFNLPPSSKPIKTEFQSAARR